jgi:hypothetical protein
MKVTKRFLCVVGAAFFTAFSGCYQLMNGADPSQGEMTSQSGQRVAVYRDMVGHEYYYEKGSKVYVTQPDGTAAADHPTKSPPPPSESQRP